MIDLVAATPPDARLGELGNGQLLALLARGVPVIDIRRPAEWEATGVIAGSLLLTFFDERGGYDLDGWLRRIAATIGPDDVFVLVCRLGQRTDVLGRYLAGARGYAGVHHLSDGITWWLADGRPVVDAPDAPDAPDAAD
ncbi:MAG: rhodanese-like domain-containing protein [Krumholzibacteria bacterium]|nr:rhodanese-like domain-containing protein [Candidatus Krumholzibacteria bacterium]